MTELQLGHTQIIFWIEFLRSSRKAFSGDRATSPIFYIGFAHAQNMIWVWTSYKIKTSKFDLFLWTDLKSKLVNSIYFCKTQELARFYKRDLATKTFSLESLYSQPNNDR